MAMQLVYSTLAAVGLAAVTLDATAQSPVPIATPAGAGSTPIPGSTDPQQPLRAPTPGTPLARYEKALSNIIGKAWNIEIDRATAKLGLSIHQHWEVHFWVTPDGKVRDVHMMNEGGVKQEVTDATAAALAEAVLPPIPPEVATTLPRKGLEVQYTFDLYPDREPTSRAGKAAH